MIITPYKSGIQTSHPQLKILQIRQSQQQSINLSSNSIIPLSEHSLWLVKQGLVKLSASTEDGECLLLGLVGPEQTFGASLTTVEAFTAVALCDCELLRFNLSDIEASANLSLLMMRAMAARLRQSEAMLSILGQRRIEDRVRYFLELLASEYGIVTPSGILINVRLTQQDIANALSTTRVTVTRVIGQLKKQEWLRSNPERYFIIQNDNQTKRQNSPQMKPKS